MPAGSIAASEIRLAGVIRRAPNCRNAPPALNCLFSSSLTPDPRSLPPFPMSDPYFQQLFAQRIGGSQLRQRHRDLQVREDQAGQAKGAGRASRAETGRLRHRRERRNGRPVGPPRDGRGDQQAGEPRLRRQRHPGLQGGGRPAHGPRVRRGSSIRPPRSITASARRPALAMLPAAFIDPGDVTLMTVPGYPVAGTHTKYYGGEVHRLPLSGRERFSARPGRDSRRHSPPGEAAGDQLSEQSDGQGGHARVLRAGDRFRPGQPASWWSRTPPTSCSATTHRR